jgi:tRNA(Ile)-lysidine synthase
MGIEVFAAHFDHQLRGLESARDRTFVKNFCRENGIELEIGFGRVREYAGENGLGTEDAARELRYEFLDRAADKFGCDRIATAHNADDNAETVLLHLARGAGTGGLRGIPPVRGRIVRPLLGTTRAEIMEYLARNGINHVEDSSNAGDEYSRNVIRHKIIPVMRELNPAFSRSVVRECENLREDEDYFSDLADKFVSGFFRGGSLPVGELSALPRPVQARVLRKLCGRGLSRENCRALYSLMETRGRGRADVPGMRVEKDGDRLYFGAAETGQAEDVLIVPGETAGFGAGFSVTAEIIDECKEINSSFKTFYFKYASICDNIFCTCRRDGDRIRIFGRGCTKTLKALYNEAGLSHSQRAANPVIRDGAGPVAVYGFGMAERCAAAPGDRVLRINIEKTGETGNA